MKTASGLAGGCQPSMASLHVFLLFQNPLKVHSAGSTVCRRACSQCHSPNFFQSVFWDITLEVLPSSFIAKAIILQGGGEGGKGVVKGW